MFFVKLPEPMLVPNEWTRPVLERLSAEDVIALAARSGHSDVWAEQIASMRFRRVVRRLDPVADLADLLPAIADGLPGLNQGTSDDTAKGADCDNVERIGQGVEASNTVDTVVEVVATIADVTDTELSRIITDGLESIRRVQRAYGGVTGFPLTPVSRSQLPAAMPVFVFDPSTPFDQRHERPVMFAPRPKPRFVPVDTPVLDNDKIAAIDHLYGTLGRRAPFRFGESLMQEARRLIDDHDDPRSSISTIATACEVLIDDVLACMMWEEGRRPEQAASLFGQQLLQRLRSNNFRSRLGGDWDPDGDGPVGEWVRRVAWRRNNMLHTGQDMTLDEAQDAWQAAFELLQFVRAELLEAANRYGRTAWMLLGASNVPAPIKEAHIEPLLADPDETTWADCSAHWIRVMRYSHKHGEWKRPAHPNDLALIAVIHPDRHIVWAVVDERHERGLVLQDPSPWVNAEQQQATAAIRPADDGDDAFSVRMAKPAQEALDDNPFPVDGQWIAAYRLLPGHPAMVTGEQLDYVARQRNRPR